MTVTLAELPAGEAKVAGYVVRLCLIHGSFPPRQVRQKMPRAPAVVVNEDGAISLLCEKRSELIDQSAVIVWHGNLLARLK